MHVLFLLLALSGDPAPEADAPAPRAAISGDETVMVGRMARLSGVESENAKSYRWIVRPKPDDMEISGSKGSELRISHGAAAVFEIELIVGGSDGETDVQFSELEFRSAISAQAADRAVSSAGPASSPTVAELALALQHLKQLQEAMQPAQPQPQHPVGMVSPTMPTAAMMGHMPQNPANAVNWPQGVKVLAERVRSGTRKQEAIIVSGSFRSVANRIKTGTLASGDPWAEVQAQAREALGGAYGPWGGFFLELGELVGGLKQQGRLPNPQASVLLLESAAEALGSL